MGMSTYVVGIKPADEKFNQMLEIYELCTAADVDIPAAVDEFFDNEKPDEAGVVVEIEEATTEYRGDMQDGLEVDLRQLSPDIKIIRFYNSY